MQVPVTDVISAGKINSCQQEMRILPLSTSIRNQQVSEIFYDVQRCKTTNSHALLALHCTRIFYNCFKQYIFFTVLTPGNVSGSCLTLKPAKKNSAGSRKGGSMCNTSEMSFISM